jgi:hypothetical protein
MGAYSTGVYIPVVGETGWGTQVSDALQQLSSLGVNVTAAPYGAVGNNVTDDAPAFRLAIAAAKASGGPVIVPRPPGGAYYLGTEIDLSDNAGLHIVGGTQHSLASQFGRPPQVLLRGNSASRSVFYIDGGGPESGGNITFSNIGIYGDSQNCVYVHRAAQIEFRNCGFVPGAGASSTNAGLLLDNSFWITLRDCQIHASASGKPAILARGVSGSNVIGLAQFHASDCVFVTGGLKYEQDFATANESHHWRLENCVTESFPAGAALISTSLNGGTLGAFSSITLTQCEIADAAGTAPLILHDCVGTPMRYVTIDGCAAPGFRAIQVNAGTVSRVDIRSPASLVVDSSGNPIGSWTMWKTAGQTIAGTSASLAETDVQANAGPASKWAKDADKWASVGIEPGTGSTSGLMFGAGGAGADPGWDTNLYRNAANQLKTDDAFTTALALTAGKALVQKDTDLTDAATVAVDASLGTHFMLVTASSRTIGAPTNPTVGQVIHFIIYANGGGIVTTWNAAYHMAGAWVDPANAKYRTITFAYISHAGVGDRWIELSRAAADIT